jgi:hypothetical protein
MSLPSTWLTTSTSQSRAPARSSLPIPSPSRDLDKFTSAMAAMKIGETLSSSLEDRVTHNSPVSSPRVEMIDIFEETVVPSSSAPKAPQKKQRQPLRAHRDSGSPDHKGFRFAPLHHSKFIFDERSASPEKDSMVIESEEYPSTPLITSNTDRSVPDAPMKRKVFLARRDKLRLDATEALILRQMSDSQDFYLASTEVESKKRTREEKEAEIPVTVPKKRRLAMEELPSKEKDDVSSLDLELKKIDVMPSFPFCPADQIHMFYNLIIHSTTQVWLGMDGNNGRVGQISFFLPPQIDENLFKTQLEQALTSGNGCIVHQGNKGLFHLDINGTCFDVEVTLLNGKIHTVQPVFHFEKYDPTKESIRVAYLSRSFAGDPTNQCVYELSSSKLIDLVKAHFSAPSFKCPIVYETEDTLFVDVGILDENCPFKGNTSEDKFPSKGLIIAILKSAVENRMSF